jgi:hypothetical protein
MPEKSRIIALAVFPVVAVTAYVLLRRAAGDLPAPLAGTTEWARDWLALTAALYVANFVIAWVYRASWAMTLARSLAWAVAAYVCISNLVDLVGGNQEAAWQILGAEGPAGADDVLALRARAAGWGLSLAGAILCIAVGFERPGDSEAGEGPAAGAVDDEE